MGFVLFFKEKMLETRDIVKHRKTGAIGVIVPTIYLLREDGPISVIFEGQSFASVIENESDYEVIGKEQPVADYDGCGVGRGEKACKFCVVTSSHLECMRFSEMHYSLIFKSMGAKREPVSLFPKCKLQKE